MHQSILLICLWTLLSAACGHKIAQDQGALNATESMPVNDSDKFKTLAQIANENGFKVESYQVVTEDGYVLGLYRIPGYLKYDGAKKTEKKPPILLQHALVCDMMVWVMNDPEVAHAFYLARAGYDVWLGNNRGNRFSNGHTKLDPKSREYWLFDWEEMGTMDQPAVIDFILEKTGFDKISYMGHSQGTTQLMAGASLMPEYYNNKIKIAVLLAPPAAMYHNNLVSLRFMAEPLNMKLMLAALDEIKFWNILPYDYRFNALAEAVCKLLDGKICDLVFEVMDHWSSIDNTDRKDMYVSNLPSGASAYSYSHYGQLVHLKEPTFRRYDHGHDVNMEKYGQATPPSYNLSAINFPTLLVSGSVDDLADPKDVAWLVTQLNPDILIGHKQYELAHESFMVAKDMEWFTGYVFDILQKYNGKHQEESINRSKIDDKDVSIQDKDQDNNLYLV